MAEAVLHHRTPAFSTVIERVRDGLKHVFQTQQDVLCVVGTGTAGMDGAVANFLRRGDKALYVNSGKFGQRWGKILTAYGCEPIELEVEWGQPVDPAAVAGLLDQHSDIRAVYLQASETSTGTLHPFREIGDLCRDRDLLYVVDGITAVGVLDIALDRDGIDVLVSGAQKAFMLPPGLAFVGVSEKAWRFNESSDLPRFYLDFAAERRSANKNQTAFTSAVSLMSGLDESLRLIREEGLENVWARHARLAAATRAAMAALGCELFSKAPVNGITAVYSPGGMDATKIVGRLRDHYNLTIAGGQDHAKGKIFRVAHMGHFDDLDVLTVTAAIESALADVGFGVKRGAGVAAAEELLAGGQA
jgi:aspartate aminotransferase-like enzyme